MDIDPTTAKSIRQRMAQKMRSLADFMDRGSLDENGNEILDEKSLVLNTGVGRRPTQDERIQMYIRQVQLSMQERYGGEVDLSDEEDFSDDERFELLTGYELDAFVDEYPVRPATPKADEQTAQNDALSAPTQTSPE